MERHIEAIEKAQKKITALQGLPEEKKESFQERSENR